MTITGDTRLPRIPLRGTDRFFIGGRWVAPSSDATIDVVEAATEQPYYSVPAAQASDMDHAVTAAAEAFHEGPWPRMSHQERAGYLRAIAAKLRERTEDSAQIWPRESGILYSAASTRMGGIASAWEYFAGLADTFDWTEPAVPSAGAFAEIVKEPVGVVGAIIPWNGPPALIVWKAAPALIAGCTVVLKNAPEAPGAGYLMAEICEEIGLPPGVFNVVTAERDVSELLVRDPRVDNSSTIAQEEIFGPVLSVIPAQDEDDAVRIANDTIYGLNASVFTQDVTRARVVARRLRAGTVGHNAHRTDFFVGFGGFKQSGIGREGGVEGLRMYLENKSVILNEVPPA